MSDTEPSDKDGRIRCPECGLITSVDQMDFHRNNIKCRARQNEQKVKAKGLENLMKHNAMSPRIQDYINENGDGVTKMRTIYVRSENQTQPSMESYLYARPEDIYEAKKNLLPNTQKNGRKGRRIYENDTRIGVKFERTRKRGYEVKIYTKDRRKSVDPDTFYAWKDYDRVLFDSQGERVGVKLDREELSDSERNELRRKIVKASL